MIPAMSDEYKSITGFLDVAASGEPQRISEHPDKTSTLVCAFCYQLIAGKRYLVGSKAACTKCAMAAKAAAVEAGETVVLGPGVNTAQESSAAFAKRLLFGACAAVLGLAITSIFAILTGAYPGFLGPAVGWLVAKAIRSGGSGPAGRGSQIAAAVMTYVAISLAEIPAVIAQLQGQGRVSSTDMAALDWTKFLPIAILGSLLSPLLLLRGIFDVMGFMALLAGLLIAYKTASVRSASVVSGQAS